MRDIPKDINIFHFPEVPPSQRHELLVKKLRQCQVVFDFNDPASDLANKEVKRATLQELVEYVSIANGVITEAVYPDIIRTVSTALASNFRKPNVSYLDLSLQSICSALFRYR